MVLSEQGIYVSRLTGVDTKTCGKVSFPCRTISYGLQQLSTGLIIYLDGTGTFNNPYACEALDPGHPGIYLNESVSFVSVTSRAHISCFHGNHWFADGTKHKQGIRISFSGLTFLNTSVQLFDAFVAVDDTVFAETKRVSLDMQVVKLPRFDLSLNNVVFEKDTACIRIISMSSKVSVNVTNTVFYQNGDSSSNISSIIWLNSTKSLINIQVTNCSFKKNMIKEYGMIFVENELGTTNISFDQLKLEENSKNESSTNVFGGAFIVRSALVFMSLKYSFIFNTSNTFLRVIGQSAEINISNIKVDGYYSSNLGGGVVDLFQLDSCSLSIKDSSFRNGNINGDGGVVSMLAPNSTLIIQNSIIDNTSSSHYGGAVFILSTAIDYKQSTKRTKNFFVLIRIINSSFLYSSSGKKGGAVNINAKKLSAIIRDSLFLRCHASSGGALNFLTSDSTTISLHNSNFSENSADDGAIVHAGSIGYDCSYNLFITNITFSKNRIYSQKLFVSSIATFLGNCTKSTVDLKNTHFVNNLAGGGAAIHIIFPMSTLNYVTFDTCIFRKNVGNSGTIRVGGKTLLTCKYSIFDSNGVHDRSREAALVNNFFLKDSVIRIMNTTFFNNSCQIITAVLGGLSSLTIINSDFVRNNNIRSTAPLNILPNQNQLNSRITIFVEKVLFQDNIARFGVLYMDSGEAEVVNCTFLNNFAFSTGGIIMLSGVGGNGRNSSKFVIRHSVFTQTITKFYDNVIMTTSFLRFFGPITLTVVNSTFNQTTKSDVPLILVTTANMIRFDNKSVGSCPLGHDIEKTYYVYNRDITGYFNKFASLTGLTFSCKECFYNFYSLQRGTARGLNVGDSFHCLPCPRGADCVSAIKSKANYWGYHVSSNPPKLAFTICPFGYCMSPSTNSTDYNACQGKRTGVMCGMCSKGYTEALWSTYCTPVKDCNDYWFWILFLILVFSMAIILVFKPPFVAYCLKQIFCFKTRSRSTDIQDNHDIIPSTSKEETPQENNISLSSREQNKQDKRQFSRFVDIIFYFYQIAQLLLSSSSLKEFFDSQFLEPVLGYFNFQPSFSKQGFLCPFPGLTPKTKLVFKIAPVFGTLIAIFFIYALHSFICCTRGAIRPAIAPYLQASIKTVFLGYVTLATVSISLIRCVDVADESRWFYNGNITCYQWWHYASFTFIAIFVLPFIFVVSFVSFKLHQNKITVRQFLLAIIFPLPFLMVWLLRFTYSSPVANVQENQNIKALKEMLLAPYKQPNDRSKGGALYWQSVLIARRFVLVLIFSIVTELSIRLFCMTIVCVVVLYCHVKVRPFQNSLANNFESLSLFFLIILGLVNLFKSVFVGSEQNIKGSLITVLKVFQWLETVMLGLFPAVLLLLLSFALISFLLRVLVVCCRSSFKFLFRPCAQRWMSYDTTYLLNVCDNTEDD